MDSSCLPLLKTQIDAALQAGTPQAMADLAAQLEAAAAQIQGAKPGPIELSSALQLLQDTWMKAVQPTAALPGDPGQQAALADLIAAILETQQFALILAQGDLTQPLHRRGIMAGTLKSLQASLRHLTWQTERIAKGDFSQQVEFMGEFSRSFNAMVAGLAEARKRIQDQNEELARINASLQNEISQRRLVDARSEIRRRLIEQREQERLQIARDLHDGPLQDLIGLTFSLNELTHLEDDAGNPAIREELQEINATVHALIAELRQFAGELRPPALAQFGLKKAIASHVEIFLQKHSEMRIALDLDFEDGGLPETLRLAFYRIFQESLNNILKHAHASQINVQLRRQPSHLLMQIEDDGAGFQLPEDWLELAQHGHLGLVGIRERVDAIGGSVEIQSQPGQGTKICVTAPVL